MVIDKPFVGAESIFYHETRYFGFRYTIYFNGHAMHMGNSDSLGFKPLPGSNLVVATPNGCKPLKAYHNNVLMDVREIPGEIANF